MLNPDRVVERELKKYDHNLSFKWNNEKRYWEVWYRRPSGNKLITPVVGNLFDEGGLSYAPLDRRILKWIFSSDTGRARGKWRWLDRKRFHERLGREKARSHRKMFNIAQDNYYLLNDEGPRKHIDVPDFVRPDAKSAMDNRTYLRTAENVHEYRRSLKK